MRTINCVPARPTLTLRRDNLDKARADAGIVTDQQLAGAMHYDQGNLSRVLTGKSRPGLAFIAGLLAVFGVERFAELFYLVTDEAA